MSKSAIPSGTAHNLPADLKKALLSDKKALALWESLTPLARNEWICWVVFVKKDETRTECYKSISGGNCKTQTLGGCYPD